MEKRVIKIRRRVKKLKTKPGAYKLKLGTGLIWKSPTLAWIGLLSIIMALSASSRVNAQLQNLFDDFGKVVKVVWNNVDNIDELKTTTNALKTVVRSSPVEGVLGSLGKVKLPRESSAYRLRTDPSNLSGIAGQISDNAKIRITEVNSEFPGWLRIEEVASSALDDNRNQGWIPSALVCNGHGLLPLCDPKSLPISKPIQGFWANLFRPNAKTNADVLNVHRTPSVESPPLSIQLGYEENIQVYDVYGGWVQIIYPSYLDQNGNTSYDVGWVASAYVCSDVIKIVAGCNARIAGQTRGSIPVP